MNVLPNFPDEPELQHPTKWSVRLDFVPRDLWIGVFVGNRSRLSWRTQRKPYYPGGSVAVHEQKTFVCIVPCFPIVITRRHEIDKPYYGQ